MSLNIVTWKPKGRPSNAVTDGKRYYRIERKAIFFFLKNKGKGNGYHQCTGKQIKIHIYVASDRGMLGQTTRLTPPPDKGHGTHRDCYAITTSLVTH